MKNYIIIKRKPVSFAATQLNVEMQQTRRVYVLLAKRRPPYRRASINIVYFLYFFTKNVLKSSKKNNKITSPLRRRM